jgi:DNA-directed RNA polymerase specialized sigma24 family protein
MRERLARRHERAFERSYRRHIDDVYHYALGVLRDPLDAEQVTQTTFLNAHREFRRVGGRAPGLNSLLALAHDVCRMRGGYLHPENVDFCVDGEFTRAADCQEAEFAVSRELDDRLSRKETRLLRTHLRSCEDCGDFARGQQAQRDAIRALAAIPLPDKLESFFGTRGASLRLRTGARLAALAGTTALVVALISSGGFPHPAGFIGQEPEPNVEAAVVKRVDFNRAQAKKAKPKAKKAKKMKRKFRRRATSP